MKTIQLGQIATMRYGKLPPKEQLDSGYPIFTGYRVSGFAKAYIYEKPMLVVVARGVGGTGDVKISPPKSWITNLSIVLELDDQQADRQFMCYYLSQQSLKEKLDTGSAQAQITVNALSAYYVTIPPLPVQRRIASILSAYDDLIENNTRRIAILEEMARRIYEEWFVRFRFPGHEQVKMVESELGLIPEGWAVGTINDIVRLLSGFAFKSADFTDDGNYPLVTIKNVHDGVFIEDCTSHLADLPTRMPKHCLLARGDVLLSLTGNIGRCCVVTGNGYLLNQRVAKIDPIREVDRSYSYFFFRSTTTQESLSRIANGVAQQNLSPVETGRMAALIAPEKRRDSFSSLAAPIFQQMLVLRKKNANLRATRDLLLPKLISGELDVSALPVLEPT